MKSFMVVIDYKVVQFKMTKLPLSTMSTVIGYVEVMLSGSVTIPFATIHKGDVVDFVEGVEFEGDDDVKVCQKLREDVIKRFYGG